MLQYHSFFFELEKLMYSSNGNPRRKALFCKTECFPFFSAAPCLRERYIFQSCDIESTLKSHLMPRQGQEHVSNLLKEAGTDEARKTERDCNGESRLNF